MNTLLLRRIAAWAIALGILATGAYAQEKAPARTGTLRIGSRPMACIVRVGGNSYEKTGPTLLLGDLPAGRYTVQFIQDEHMVQKTVDVRMGETTVVFGNLLASTAPSPKDDIKAIAQRRPAPTVAPQDKTVAPPAPVATATPAPQTPAPSGIPPRGESIEDANDTFEAAEMLRTALNPLQKEKRYRKAEALYQKILRRWPNSDKAEACHYWIGKIHESIYFREYRKAIQEYEAVLTMNPSTMFDARWRIAVLYDNRLGEFPTARRSYEKAAQHSASQGIREKAQMQAEVLKNRGF